MLSLTNFAIKKTMDICTKVTLRQRLLPSGKITLYLDYYPAIRNLKTNRSQRHEYMGIYLYGNPSNQVQRNFNKTMLEKAELIRCRRQEQVINRQFGFIDHTHSGRTSSPILREYARNVMKSGRLYSCTSASSPVANAHSAM